MNTVSIGIRREEGEFFILATLNNNDRFLSDSEFGQLIQDTRNWLNDRITDCVQVIERQDAPDSVNTDEECWS